MGRKWIFSLLCSMTTLFAQENLELLLDEYKNAADLSNITKQEAAGFLDLYTREDIEKMQAHNLIDVLKTITGLYVVRKSNSLISFQKASLSSMPLAASRLYINDHDVSSTTFSSAFLIWGEMPIEFVDHIEVYKATSSIEFGNETAPLIIRVYTKDASRENGGKIKITGDNLGSVSLDTYYAQEIRKDFSYFIYAQGGSIQRKEYQNYFNDKTYTASSDRKEATFYCNINYKDWKIEAANYYKKSDNFFGRGDYKTPSGGDVDNDHAYIHITKQLPYDTTIQFSFDTIKYEREYIDENGIGIFDGEGNVLEVNPLIISYHDSIYSFMLEKETKYKNHRFMIGGFYKYKTSKADGSFAHLDDATLLEHFGYTNGLHLASLYVEENYNIDKDTFLNASLKGDFYRYDKVVDSAIHYVARIGGIKNYNNFQFKLFFTDTYLPLSFYQVYNDNNIPYMVNPHLDSPQLNILSSSIRYKNDHHEIEFIYTYNKIKESIVYSKPDFIPQNSSQKQSYTRYELRYNYQYDFNNRLIFSYFWAGNSSDVELSPDTGINIRIYNSFGKLDLYNELLYRTAYRSAYGNDIKESFDYTVALKYHCSKDLHIGLRGENLFDDSYKVDYKNVYPVENYDRKIWLEVGYMF